MVDGCRGCRASAQTETYRCGGRYGHIVQHARLGDLSYDAVEDCRNYAGCLGSCGPGEPEMPAVNTNLKDNLEFQPGHRRE